MAAEADRGSMVFLSYDFVKIENNFSKAVDLAHIA